MSRDDASRASRTCFQKVSPALQHVVLNALQYLTVSINFSRKKSLYHVLGRYANMEEINMVKPKKKKRMF